MKHTPGPWIMTIINAQRQFEIHAEDGTLVALATPVDRHGVFKTQANARLIAAAPELLEACKYALRCFEVMDRDYALGNYPRGVSVTLEAAIQKAEGGQ
jgi:hypothetical protein